MRRAGAEGSHPVLHFKGNAIFAHDHSLIAQSAGLPLNDKAPERVTGRTEQAFTHGAGRLPLSPAGGLDLLAVML